MTTTFGGVTLPDASKIEETPEILLEETVLMSGERSIQSNTSYGFGATYHCLGTWAQYKAVLALVGVASSLVTEAGETYTKCYISSIKVKESDSPLSYLFDVGFRQDTT